MRIELGKLVGPCFCRVSGICSVWQAASARVASGVKFDVRIDVPFDVRFDVPFDVPLDVR